MAIFLGFLFYLFFPTRQQHIKRQDSNLKKNGLDAVQAENRVVSPYPAGSLLATTDAAHAPLFVPRHPLNVLPKQNLARPAPAIIAGEKAPKLLLVPTHEAVGACLEAHVKLTLAPILINPLLVDADVTPEDSLIHIPAHPISSAHCHLVSECNKNNYPTHDIYLEPHKKSLDPCVPVRLIAVLVVQEGLLLLPTFPERCKGQLDQPVP
jgi:hypothetical protein